MPCCRIKFNGMTTTKRAVGKTFTYVTCPAGTDFENPPAPVYECDLAKGLLKPATIPQCVFKLNDTFIDCGNLVNLPCAPSDGQWTCGAEELIPPTDECEEGCYCPEGTVFHEDNCIVEDECPCEYNGVMYKAGESYNLECQNCVCKKGIWSCRTTGKSGCTATCSIIGDPHYTTFDGRRYDFMGKCFYTLVKTHDLVIESEQWPWDGNPPNENNKDMVSYVRAVTIRQKKVVIVIEQRKIVKVNGQFITKLPYEIRGIKIKECSSIYICVHLPDGVRIDYDGRNSMYIIVPISYKEKKTQGLCGTFNKDPSDDFMAPDGTIQEKPSIFGNTWKRYGNCSNISPDGLPHPCEKNEIVRKTADKYCEAIKSSLFKDCHNLVNMESYYENCMYDGCACEAKKLSTCFCPMISEYARDCALKGAIIDWTKTVTECEVKCPEGQTYQVCGTSCTRSCADISLEPNCIDTCVPGCNCPKGETLDDDGNCIPINECQCEKDQIKFPAGFKEIRNNAELCTCERATWKCEAATPEEINKYPNIDNLIASCDKSLHLEFTTCEPDEPKTCENMHVYPKILPPTMCKEGCTCKDGYVWNKKECILVEECPCELGGKSYNEGSIVQKDCNTCTCNSKTWTCTNKMCTSDCTAWSGTHYKTFDGKLYDFIGECQYTLVISENFTIDIENIACGDTVCLYSITIQIGSRSPSETLKLTTDKPIPNKKRIPKQFSIRKIDLLYIIEVSNLDLIIYWDGFKRVSVKLDSKWKRKVTGLCGNFDGNKADDLKPNSTTVTITKFADFWKSKYHCPATYKLTDSCINKPDETFLALKRCSVLYSKMFKPCHKKVPVKSYYKNCLYDICASDIKMFYENTCSAIAVYAQECAIKGVPISWRSQQLCPMQCDENSYYSPCIPTCPILDKHGKPPKACEKYSCVEGCFYKNKPSDNNTPQIV